MKLLAGLLICWTFEVNAVPLKKLPQEWEPACFMEHVKPFQEDVVKLFAEKEALEKENKKLKEMLKKVLVELQAIKTLNNSIQSDINPYE
jgi:hypothetical protein